MSMFHELMMKKKGIPSRYQEVEYIESTGTQYIDTGVQNYGYKSQTRIEFTKIENTNRQLMGQSLSGFWGLNTSGYFEIYNASELKAQLNTKYDVTFEVTSDNTYSYRSLSVNDNILFSNLQSSRKPNGGNILLGALLDGGNYYYCYAKIYSQKIWDYTGTLVRNFVPVYDTETQKYGMWESVQGKFYGNDGTGDFAGA